MCRSVRLTSVGALAVRGKLRGEEPSRSEEFQVLVIGLFDGIGALRVAMELQGVSVIGYVSVEKEAGARRVVESHFPGVVHYVDVTCIHETEVKEWSLRFSQCNLVVVGAGPPCQGVSTRIARGRFEMPGPACSPTCLASLSWSEPHFLGARSTH